MTDKEKKAKKLIKFAQNKDLAAFDELQNLNENLQKLTETIQNKESVAPVVSMEGVETIKGDQGATGPTGPQGEKGDKGDMGPQGPQGEPGPQGPAGNDGDVGLDGLDGARGATGPTGPAGSPDTPTQVRDKLSSLQKEERLDISAIKGTDKLKEEIAQYSTSEVKRGVLYAGLMRGGGGGHTIQDEGTDLTQRTKLNFVGAGVTVTDDAGNDTTQVDISGGGGGGATGPTGAQGPQGTQGTQGSIGIQGPQGTQGTQGSLGPTGATGAQGPQGPQGTQGTQGSLGPTGATGAQGAQGTQGSQGSIGIQGPTGPTGAGHTIQDEGTPLTQRTNLNFVGAGVTVTDDSGNDATVVTISSTGGGATGPTGAQGPQGTQGTQGSIGATGPTGAQGPQGTQGTQGSLGPTGATGAQGPQGTQGSQGSQSTAPGAQGTQGTQGSLGPTGATGATGALGNALPWNFSGPTSATAPTNGNIRLNATGFSNTTQIYISEIDSLGTTVDTWLSNLATSTSTNKAIMYIVKASDPSVFAVYLVTALTDNGSWDQINVTYLNSNGAFTGGDSVYVTFTMTGEKGQTGPQGTQGSQGSIGATGNQGAQGTQGTQGSLGPTGATGAQGAQGTQGTQGSLGPTGATGSQGAQGTQGSQGSVGQTGYVPPRVTSTGSTLSPNPDSDIADIYKLTAQAGTAAFTGPSGSPVDGQKLIIEILATGSTRNITWGALFTAGGVALPTTATVAKKVTMGFEYDTSNSLNKWMCIAVATQT